MTIALIIVGTLLAVAAAVSGAGKLRRLPRVVASMHAVGVTDRQMPILAALEFAGALGLLVGVWVVPLGIAAAIGLLLYFLGAVVSHIRARSPIQETIPATALLILAVATVLLELAR